MKLKYHRFSLILLICVFVIIAAIITGCSKGEEAGTTTTVPGGAGTQTGAGSATTQGAMPTPSPTPGSTPSAVPGTGGVTPPTTVPSQPTTPMPITDKNAIPIEQIPLKSPIQRTTFTQGGITIDYLRFKYADADGKLYICDIPASEAKQNRSIENWMSTLAFYSKEVPPKIVDKKQQKKVDRLSDFPFVSPPPR